MSKLYIGVMSGTSLDGIDVALCEVDADGCQLILSQEFSFDKELKKDVLHAIKNPIFLRDVGILDNRLGKIFADAINTFLQKNNIDGTTITAIGLHGQTLWHEPNAKYPFSMQLGDANVVTAQTDINVVADFRGKDVALGGQGAPFAPAFHKFIFGSLKEDVAVLNIGGMANITLLEEKLIGYDTGCGNVLMDYWIGKNLNQPYDKNGEWAKSGKINNPLLKEMLSDNFFSKPPPKSTGRELFNAAWLQRHLCRFPVLKSEDIQATLLELTAQSIANEVKKSSTKLLIVCGGGAKNKHLMQRVQELLSEVQITSSDAYGVSGDFMEAMAFAWLAYKRINNEKVQLSSVTGAKKDSILGAIFA